MKYLSQLNYNKIDEVLDNFSINNYFIKQENDDKPLLFHVYWYGELTKKQILCIKSYLVTQDLSKTILIVWLDCELSYTKDNIAKIPKHKNIQVKPYMPDVYAHKTLLSNQKYVTITPDKEHKDLVKYRSDLARIILLYLYGGIYYDLDMILLKDLSDFKDIEFCYQWSNQHQRGNNGLLGLKKHSVVGKDIMKSYNKVLNKFTSKYDFNTRLNKQIYNSELNINCLPCALFDPVWLTFDCDESSRYSDLNNFDDFFKYTKEKVTIDTFFNGRIYAYHWHSRNNIIVEKDSYFSRLENDINNKLNYILNE